MLSLGCNWFRMFNLSNLAFHRIACDELLFSKYYTIDCNTVPSWASETHQSKSNHSNWTVWASLALILIKSLLALMCLCQYFLIILRTLRINWFLHRILFERLLQTGFKYIPILLELTSMRTNTHGIRFEFSSVGEWLFALSMSTPSGRNDCNKIANPRRIS